MPSSCRPQVPDKSTAFDAQVHRYLRAFQKALRHRPTNLQRDLMANAAVTQARFDSGSTQSQHQRPRLGASRAHRSEGRRRHAGVVPNPTSQ
jgi:hypothetical protein